MLVNGREARCINSVVPGDVVELQQRTAPGFSPRGKPPFNVTVLLEDEHLELVERIMLHAKLSKLEEVAKLEEVDEDK